MCLLCVSVMGVSAWAEDHTGTIVFNNTGNAGTIKISGASVTGSDNLSNSWTVTTVGTTSFTAKAAYYQVGSANKPATSITFTTTLPETASISSMSAKFGGFSGTAGTIALKVGDTTIGTGSLNETSDVTVTSTSVASGQVLTVTVTGISKGVKCYNISYTYTDSKTATTLTWSESSTSAIIGESNIFPTLTTTPADLAGVTYSSSDETVATINASGVITLIKKGTTTIKASYAGNTDYLPAPDATYVLSVKEKFNESYESLTISSLGKANASDAESESANSFDMVYSQGTGNNPPKFYEDGKELRLYAKNTMTITGAMPIYKVVITCSSGNAIANTDGVSVGSLSIDGTTATWYTEGAKTITYSNSSTGQRRITNITVYYGYTRTTTADNYGTICLPFAVAAADRSGATFYSVAGVTKSDDKITGVALEEVTGDLVAGTPYIFKATDSKIVAGYKGEASAVKSATGLVGNLDAATTINAGEYIYILGTDNKMHKLSGTATATVATNRAYLNLEGVDEADASVKGVRLYFDGSEEATAIENLTPTLSQGEGAIYNLAGQHLAAPQRGINIIGGKKVLVK